MLLLFGPAGVVLAASLLAVVVIAALRTVARDRVTWDALEGVMPPAGWEDDISAVRSALSIDRDVRTVSAHPENVRFPAEFRGRRWPVVVLRSDFAELLTPAQRRAVMAHELGHYLRYDLARRAVASIAIGVSAGYAASLAVEVSLAYFALLLPAPFLVFGAHRQCEFGADRVAVDATRDPQAVIQSIWQASMFEGQRLGKSATPQRAESRWESDDLLAPHPSPGRRQAAVERYWRHHQPSKMRRDTR